MRWPGIEPGSNAWKASMLTITPPTLEKIKSRKNSDFQYDKNLIRISSSQLKKKRLDLSGNRFRDLGGLQFEGKALEYVNLDDNKIDRLQE